MEPRTFRLKKGMRIFCWIMTWICVPLIVTIPFAIMMGRLAARGSMTVAEDKVTHRWVRSREMAWDGITKFEWGVRTGGLIGVMMGRPLHVYVGEKRQAWGWMVNAFEDSEQLIELIKARTGQEF